MLGGGRERILFDHSESYNSDSLYDSARLLGDMRARTSEK